MTEAEQGWYRDPKSPGRDAYWTGTEFSRSRPSRPGTPHLRKSGELAAEPATDTQPNTVTEDPRTWTLDRAAGNRLAQHMEGVAFRATGMLLLFLALAAFAIGLITGIGTVKAGDSAECGSAFSPDDVSTSFTLSDTGKDTCVREIQRAQTVATGWLVAGGVIIVGAAIAGGIAASRRPTN